MKKMVGSFGLALVLLGSMSTALADIFQVTITRDVTDALPGDGNCQTLPGGGDCSLRAAIQEANALGGAHTIKLPQGIYNLALIGPGEDAAAMGDLDICGSEVTIEGAGTNLSIIDGLKADRVFDVMKSCVGGKMLVLKDLTIRNGERFTVTGDGNEYQAGGGIRNDGGLVELHRVDVLRNKGSIGGGILNSRQGLLKIYHSTIRYNVANGNGGGICNCANAGPLIIEDSILEGNLGRGGGGLAANTGHVGFLRSAVIDNTSQTTEGGGLYLAQVDATLSLTTVSGNSAPQNGGGIYASTGFANFGRNLTLNRSTITRNSSSGTPDPKYDGPIGGAGVYADEGMTLTLRDSIIAGNSLGDSHQQCFREDDDGSDIVATGTNLIDDGSCGGLASDPLLAPLAFDGGATPVHPLLNGSPAIAATTCSTETSPGVGGELDQRGYLRPADCSVGAYEWDESNIRAEGLLDPLTVTANVVTNENTVLGPSVDEPPTLLVSPGATATIGIGYGATNRFIGPEGLLIETRPEQGSVALELFDGGVLGPMVRVTLSADVTASGSDSFSFRICDTTVCSTRVEIPIHYSDLAGAPGATTPSLSSGTLNDYGRTADGSLEQQYPDSGYDHHGGVFYYHISDSSQQPTLVIDIPADVSLPVGAVVRGLRADGTWATLGNATLDPVNGTITLVLRDGDAYDQDARFDEIFGQVALATVVSNDSGGGSGSGDGGGDGSGGGGGSSDETDDTPQVGGGTPPPTSGGGGGGGSSGALSLLLMATALGWRHRRPRGRAK